jgi:hypothetical protein
MEIGYIGNFSAYHTEIGVAEAIEGLGHKVDRYHYKQMNPAVFLGRKYDLVMASCPQVSPPEFWAAIRAPLVAHYFDWIWGYANREKAYIPRLKHFDLVLSTDGYDGTRYKDINRRYLKQAFNPDWFYPHKRQGGSEIGFVGHIYTPQRRGLIKELAKRFDVRVYGQKNEARGPARSYVVADSRIMLADGGIQTDIPGYWSNRVYLDLACGGFVLHKAVPGLEDVFTPGTHLDTWTSAEELHEKCAYYLGHPDEREAIARAGCELVHERHTWDERIREWEGFIRELA